MKAAALRQLEYERREDRKVQREREEEGDIKCIKEHKLLTQLTRLRWKDRSLEILTTEHSILTGAPSQFSEKRNLNIPIIVFL